MVSNSGVSQAPAEEPAPAEAEGAREWGLAVSLAGVSLSLVARWPPAELLFAQFTRLRLTVARASHSAQLALSVDSMQWDNQVRNILSLLENFHFNIYVRVLKSPLMMFVKDG